MSSNQSSEGRPVEVHITTVDVIDRDAMPLITSLAFGERHSSQMINMSNKGLVPAGFINGFIPEPAGGLTVRINVDQNTNDGNAVVILDTGMPLRVFQQHPVDLDMIPGVKNYIVLEGYYEEGIETTQVSATATKEPARLRRLIEGEVTDTQLIIASIDLSGGQNNVTNEMIDVSMRTSAGLDWMSHAKDADPHPQYNNHQSVKILNANQDTIEFGRRHVVTNSYETELLPVTDSMYFELQVLSTLDLEINSVRLRIPPGEKCYFEGEEGTEAFSIQDHTTLKFTRIGGAWHGSR